MQVIMTKTDELKQVADGYARNYLFPRQLAIPATEQAVKNSEQKRAAYQAEQTKLKQANQALASQLKGGEVTVQAKANAAGTLFAALGMSEIAQALNASKQITVAEQYLTCDPIKKLGNYTATVKLPDSEAVPLSVKVVAANE